MPYFHGWAHDKMECARGCMDLLAAEGYVTYDPQMGRIIASADVDEMAALYRGMDDKLPGILAATKPWWKFW